MLVDMDFACCATLLERDSVREREREVGEKRANFSPILGNGQKISLVFFSL